MLLWCIWKVNHSIIVIWNLRAESLEINWSNCPTILLTGTDTQGHTLSLGAPVQCPLQYLCCLSSRSPWKVLKYNHNAEFFKTLVLPLKMETEYVWIGEVTSALFPGLQNESVNCQVPPARIFYHSLIPGPGLFPKIYSKVSYTGTEFLNSSTVDIWSQIILCGGGCPVPRRIFSSIPGLYPPGARHATTPSVSRHCRCPLGAEMSCREPSLLKPEGHHPVKVPVSIKQG